MNHALELSLPSRELSQIGGKILFKVTCLLVKSSEVNDLYTRKGGIQLDSGIAQHEPSLGRTTVSFSEVSLQHEGGVKGIPHSRLGPLYGEREIRAMTLKL